MIERNARGDAGLQRVREIDYDKLRIGRNIRVISCDGDVAGTRQGTIRIEGQRPL